MSLEELDTIRETFKTTAVLIELQIDYVEVTFVELKFNFVCDFQDFWSADTVAYYQQSEQLDCRI